ncbi:hypothetical protein PMX63_07970 [Collinsella aerofaciens]|uniref:hypothetical protein n=1 Tax=Collinsella aerofaciens TaxID=74426 RepID=UPI00189D9E88|nr:hypothetical protein [Collinsella aerofaciens]MDB1886064.1 hypothetical protein [Collinsella aerofaciens]MDB1889814.1 hypothetical protein [Collinsella aerofaciens]MDB1891757.1 hypothetical protein [Collinsella aerofaciens]MDB1893735.1 hypothetical protein [Collinsella aerofaciens]
MNDILARRARRATVGIALSAALVAGIAPATAIAAEASAPIDAVALQSEDAAAAKEKAHAAMQEALKKLKAAEDAASPERIAGINNMIASDQELRDIMLAHAAECREPLPAMQANVDAAQAKYDEASNLVSSLQAKLEALKALGDEAPSEAIKQLRSEIMAAKLQEESCKTTLDSYQRRLESQERQVQRFESAAEEVKAHIDEETAKRDALLDNLDKAQAAYDDACKAYEEAKAAADKTTSPEITKPAETVPPSGSTQPAETARPAGSPATGKDAAPSSAKQANSSSSKQANTTAGKLANTGDTTPSAIALAEIAAMGLGITAAATHRIKYSK